MIRKTLIGAVMLIALLATPAAAQYAPTVISPGTVVQGGSITVTGGNCQPNQSVTITVYPESPEALAGNPTVPPVITASTVADAQGNYSVTFKIPETLAPGWYDVLGPCPAIGTDVNPTRADQLYYLGRFLVVAPDTLPNGNGNGAGPGNGGTLPRTGSNLNGIGLLGAALLATGGLVLLSTRKRQSRAPQAA